MRISEVYQIYLERMGTGHGVESKVCVGGRGEVRDVFGYTLKQTFLWSELDKCVTECGR